MPKDTKIKIVIIKINGKLYDSNNKIETEESIRRILVEVDLKDNMERLYK